MASAPRAMFRLVPLFVLTLAVGIAPLTIPGLSDSASVWAQQSEELPKSPNPEDREVTRGMFALLDALHLTQHALDDEISERAFDAFLDNLDPMKVYFMQADIDEFKLNKKRLDDFTKVGDVAFAYDVFHRFLDRVDERAAMVNELLTGEFDFTKDEFVVTDPDVAVYARTPEEARDRWRKRLKLDLLYERAEEDEDDKGSEPQVEESSDAEAVDPKGVDANDVDSNGVDSNGVDSKADAAKAREAKMQEALTTLQRRYESFAKRMRHTDRFRLLEIYLTALTTAYDPHTTYMSARSLENFEISMRLELEGIGAALRSIDGYCTVNYLIPGGAADRDGRLKPEDRIVGVAQGEDGEVVDVIDWNLSDVVPLVRGNRGTIVRLEVLPADGSGKKILRIVRDKVELKDSEAYGKVFQDGDKGDGNPFNVGIIDLPSFYRDMSGASEGKQGFRSTTRDVREIIKDFKSQNVDTLILDLRRNGGGSLQEAIDLTGLFIDEGPVVQVKNPFGEVRQHNDEDSGVAWDGPLVVLTSKLSASASEILAGAIKDYGRGIVVGDPATHGKGSVQTLLDIGEQLRKGRELGALKITTQQFYRPNGESTQKLGVPADVELPSFTQHMDVGESDLDYPLPFDRVKAAEFPKLSQATGDIVRQLVERSKERVAENEEWQKLNRRIERYLDRKGRKKITLNEEKFLAERQALKAEEEEIEETLEEDTSREPTIKRDFYLDEAISIAVDYYKLLKRPKVALQ